MNRVIINSEGMDVNLEFEFLNNPTAGKIIEHLPIEAQAYIWGDEIYFDTGITAPAGNATKDVNVGDIAYWPEGKCLCIFFGRTPISRDDKPLPASEVVIVGKASVEPEILRQVKDGANIKVE